MSIKQNDSIGMKHLLLKNFFLLTKTTWSYVVRPFTSEKTPEVLVVSFVLLFISPILLVLSVISDIVLLPFLPGLHLFKPLFKAGWKYGLISAIGVTLAVIVLTQYTFFMYSYQYRAFELFLESESRQYLQVEVEYQLIETIAGQYDQILETATDAIDFMNVTEYILQKDLYFKRGTFTQDIDSITNLTTYPNMNLFGTDGKLRSHFWNHVSIGRAPRNSGEVLLLTTQSYYNHSSIKVNTTAPLLVPVSFYKEQSLLYPDAYTEVNISGVVFLDKLPKYDIVNTTVSMSTENMLELEDQLAVLSTWEISANILHSIGLTEGKANIYENLFFNVNLINAFDLQEDIDLIKQMILSLKTWYFSDLEYKEIEINSYLIDLLEDFKDEYNLYQIFMYSFLAPIITLTIIVTIYAANLVRKKRERQLIILSSRGANRVEIATYLILESIVIGGIALIVGVAVGSPLAKLLTKSAGFLSFTNPSLPLVVEAGSISRALIASIIAILVIQLINVATLLKKRRSLDYGIVERHLPSLYKYYIDVAFLLLGISLWIVYKLPDLSEEKLKTAKGIGIPAVIITLFGLILVFQRFLPWFAQSMNFIAKKLKKDIISLSLKDLFRYKSSFVRSSMILSLSFSIVINSIVVPATFQVFNEQGAYYDIGSDIVIRGFPVESQYLINYITNLEEVKSTSIVRFVNLRDVSGAFGIIYSVLFIDTSTYAETGFFREDFADDSLDTMLSQLENTGFSVLGQQDELLALDHKIGQPFNLTYKSFGEEYMAETGSYVGQSNLTVNLVNDYKFWPAFIRYEAEEDASSIYYHFVTSINNLNSIKVTPYSIQNFLFINVEEGYDIAKTASLLRGIGGTNVYDVESQLFVKPDTPRYAILFSAINSTMLMSFAINAIILTLFAAIQLIERSKEIATMKAIGISTRQLLKLYITMYFALLFFSMIIGIITGFISSSMLMGVLSVNRTIPSFTMIYPVSWIILSVSILVLAAAIGAIIPVFSTVKKEIGSELRQSA